MNFYRNHSLTKVVLLPCILSLRNLDSHYMPWTSKEILALQKLYCCFEIFFLLQILLRTVGMVVLEESNSGLHFSETFLVDLKMFSGLLKCFLFVWFCKFCLPNILQKVLKDFSHSSSHLILAQPFASFDCLRFPFCNFYCKFSIIGSNSGLKFSYKVLSLNLSQKILIFSCKRLFLEKRWNMFFSAWFCIF